MAKTAAEPAWQRIEAAVVLIFDRLLGDGDDHDRGPGILGQPLQLGPQPEVDVGVEGVQLVGPVQRQGAHGPVDAHAHSGHWLLPFPPATLVPVVVEPALLDGARQQTPPYIVIEEATDSSSAQPRIAVAPGRGGRLPGDGWCRG